MSNYLTLDQLHNPALVSVYALNLTSGPRSNLVFVAPKAGGGMDTVVLPCVALPIDLTGQVSKEALLASSEFRRAVNLGLVGLITAQEYTKRMSEPDARERVTRALQDMVHMPTGLGTDAQHHTTGQSDTTVGPSNMMIEAILSRAHEGETTERDALNQLRDLGQISLNDYKWIYRQSGVSALNLPMIRNWANGVRQQMRAK